MARTQSKDYSSIKLSILDNAANLFAEKSYSNTSIIEISEASGLSKSGIYHYFKSKREILYTMLSEHIRALFDQMGAALNSSKDPAEQFYTLSLLMMQTYSKSKSRHAVLMREIDNLPANERREIVALERQVVKFTENLIGKIKPELYLIDKAQRPVAMLFFGMMNWTYTWYDTNKGVDPDQLARMASSIFLNGLLATNFTALL
jgi:AcrR family transcriptional regulator